MWGCVGCCDWNWAHLHTRRWRWEVYKEIYVFHSTFAASTAAKEAITFPNNASISPVWTYRKECNFSLIFLAQFSSLAEKNYEISIYTPKADDQTIHQRLLLKNSTLIKLVSFHVCSELHSCTSTVISAKTIFYQLKWAALILTHSHFRHLFTAAFSQKAIDESAAFELLSCAPSPFTLLICWKLFHGQFLSAHIVVSPVRNVNIRQSTTIKLCSVSSCRAEEKHQN